MVRRTDTRSDSALIDACNTGMGNEPTLAFQVLYERHKQYVLRVARRYCDSQDISMDALQDVFTYLLQQFPPPGPGVQLNAKFTTFLYTLTRNAVLTRMRKGRSDVHVAVDPDQLADDAPGVSDDFDGLLRGITEAERELVVMRFVDGLQIAEIAEILEIPSGTVKSRLNKVVSRLRNSPFLLEYFEK